MKYIIPLLALGAYFAYFTGSKLVNWRKNYIKAKSSGLPIIVSPVYPLWYLFLALEKSISPMLKKIPIIKDGLWLDIAPGDWVWEQRYSVFEKLGSDTFIIVTPHKNVVYTCDAGAINQITTRRVDFPKPIEVYGTINTYGSNVVTVEGHEWRRHRKITAPPFSEKNNHLVWTESLYQAQNMLTQWTGRDGNSTKTWKNVSEDAMRLSLHIISRAGFNVRCLWPGVDDEDVNAIKEGAMSTAVIPSGHKMSYVEAMSTLLHRIIVVFAVPQWLDKFLPFEYVKRARLAQFEWGQYMQELYQRKISALSNFKSSSSSSSGADPSLDLMGAMISSSGILDKDAKRDPHAGLSETEIIGNSFVFMLAGHETAANTITHSLYFLAMNPKSQQKLQKELDDIFKGRPISQWDYDQDLQPLFGGMTGAVMNETLRLIPPVLIIPKSTFNMPDQKLKLEDRDAVIPTDTYIGLCANATHRNPKYWPHGSARSAADGGPVHPKNSSNDLDEFKPERWIVDPSKRTAAENEADAALQKDADDVGVNTAADTAASLYRAPKGAYIPFSEGFRACLGRRFAQVEILATLAVICQQYSVELAVDQWASEEEVRRMTRNERKEVWHKARVQAEKNLNEGMGTIITIQLRSGEIPLRFVRRGGETFKDL